MEGLVFKAYTEHRKHILVQKLLSIGMQSCFSAVTAYNGLLRNVYFTLECTQTCLVADLHPDPQGEPTTLPGPLV